MNEKHVGQLQAVAKAKAAIGELATTEASLREQHKNLLRARQRTQSQIRSVDEVVASMEQLVDEVAQRWGQRNGKTLAKECSGYMAPGVASGRMRPVKPNLPRLSLSDSGALRLDDLCAFVPDLLKERLAAMIRASDAPFGLAAEAQAAKLAELEQEIVEIETEHTATVDAAAQVDISLPLLDAVRVRRQAEQAKADREREEAELRRKGLYPAGGASIAGATVVPGGKAA